MTEHRHLHQVGRKGHRGTGRRVAAMKHFFLLVVGLLLVGLLVHLGGFENVFRIKTLRLGPIFGAFLTTIGIIGVTSARWGCIADALGGTQMAKWADYFHYFTVGRVLGFILPKDLSDFANRTIWLNQLHGLELPRAGMSVLLDRLTDVFCTFLFLFAAIPYWMGWLGLYASISLIVAAAGLTGGILLAVPGNVPLERIARWIETRFPWTKRWTGSTTSISAIPTEAPLRSTNLPTLYWLSIAKFFLSALRLVLFAMALGLPISAALFVLGMPLGQLSYLLAFTPGGLGIFEAGWFAVLRVGGVSAQNAACFTVGQRILTITLIVILSIMSQIQYTVRQRSLGRSI